MGKTDLLMEFCRGKRALFFRFCGLSFRENLRIAERVMLPHTGGAAFRDLGDFMEVLRNACSAERTVVVFDGFDCLAETSADAPGAIREFAGSLTDTGGMLVVCGRTEAMDGMLDGGLRGAFRHELTVEPLSPADTVPFHTGMSDRDVLMTYMSVGGRP